MMHTVTIFFRYKLNFRKSRKSKKTTNEETTEMAERKVKIQNELFAALGIRVDLVETVIYSAHLHYLQERCTIYKTENISPIFREKENQTLAMLVENFSITTRLRLK